MLPGLGSASVVGVGGLENFLGEGGRLYVDSSRGRSPVAGVDSVCFVFCASWLLWRMCVLVAVGGPLSPPTGCLKEDERVGRGGGSISFLGDAGRRIGGG